jgi:DNA-binding MarR family transcriptional regulator
VRSTSPVRPGDWRLDVWRRFLRTHALVVRALEQDLTADVDMPLGWYDVLLQLAEAPGRRLRMAELADRVLLSRSGLTRLVDRLENDGLVCRERSPDDHRGTFTVLTVAGVDRLRQAVPAHLAAVQRRFLDHYSDDDLRQLAQLLDHVLRRAVT